MYLEISFNDGVNGKETLSPNVRILPVPYAMRAAYADSASNKANFDIGDSLVLRDKNGDVRMVLNPNTGEFKMITGDTVWYNLKTNSPTKQLLQLPGGGFVSREHRTDNDGATFLVTNVQYGNGKGKHVHEMLTVLPNGDQNPLLIESYEKYCPNGVEIAYAKYKYQYVRDTVVDDRIMYEGFHIEERWFDCNGTLLRYTYTDPRSFTTTYEKPENTVVETVSDDEHIIIYTVGNDTFQTKHNPKTGEIRHSKRYISHVVRLEGGKTVATYNNDSTGKSSSTTINPDKKSAEHKNQDLVIYVPTTPQQCIGADLGNGDTLWWYMNTNGFEFNDVVTAEGIKSDSFVAQYDGNRRVVIRGEANGNSSTEYYDDLDRAMKETHKPETGEVKKEGVRLVKIEYDGNNNVVLEYDSTGGSKQTNRSGTIKVIESVDPKTGEITHTKEWVRHVIKMEKGETVATYHNDSTKKAASTTVNPDENKTTRENQDVQFYLPEGKQQCFGTDIGNGDTLWFYMNGQGFEFNAVILAEGVKSDSFVAQFDGNDRVVIKGEKNGNSTTRYFDDLNRVIEETRNPTTGEVKTEGLRMAKIEYDGNNNVVLEYDSAGGSKQTNQSGKIKIIESIDPKTGQVTLTKEWVRYVTKMEKGETVATYHNDSTKKSASTTVNPTQNTTTRVNLNQDVQFYLPEGKQQCFGTDIGNGDTLWFYMNDQGFEFNDAILAKGIKSDSFVVTYDSNDRVLIRAEANGNSTTRYYDDAGRLIEETRNPTTGEVKTEGIRIETREYDADNNVIYEYDSTGGSKQTNRSGSSSMSEDRDPTTGTTRYDGFDRQVYDERDLRYITQRDSGKQKNIINDTSGTIRFEWEFDANDNVVKTEGNGTKAEKKHNKDSTLTFVFTDANGNAIDIGMSPKKGEIIHSKDWIKYVVKMEKGETVATYINDSTKESASTTVIPDQKTVERKNQDFQIYVPESKQQCFGTDLGNGDTVWFYMNSNGFEFDGDVTGNGFRSDSFVTTYDDKPRATGAGRRDGSTQIRYTDDGGHVIEEVVNPTTGESTTRGVETFRWEFDTDNDVKYEYDSASNISNVRIRSGSDTMKESFDPGSRTVTFDGYNRVEYEERDLVYVTERDSGTEKNKISNASNTVVFEWDIDANDDAVRTRGNGSQAEMKHNKDSTITFVWTDDDGNAIDLKLDPQNGSQAFDGIDNTTYGQRNWQHITIRDTSKVKNRITNDAETVEFKWDYDGEAKTVTTEGNKTKEVKTHAKDTTVVWDWSDDDDNHLGMRVDPGFQSFDRFTVKLTVSDNLSDKKKTETVEDRDGKKITTVINPKDSNITHQGITYTGFEHQGIQTGYQLDAGTSWFESIDTSKSTTMALGFRQSDSTISLVGGKRMIISVPSGSFQSHLNNGSSTMGDDWNFNSSSKSTIGISSSAFVFKTGPTITFKAPNSNTLWESFADSNGQEITTLVSPKDRNIRYLGANAVRMETGNFRTGCVFDNGTSTFGSTDTSKQTTMAIGFSQSDSTISLVGGRKLEIEVPSGSFQTVVKSGTTTLGEDWNFATSSKTTIGVSSSQVVFNSNCALIQESPNGNELLIMSVDSNNNQLGLQMIPSQGLLRLDAGSNPTFFSSNIIEARNSILVNDTAFINQFASVNGNMFVGGNLQVNGLIGKGGGSFRIDHPQDPYNKYLYHSFIESPDMMNIYNGNAKTNEDGEVVVELPEYFESLNMEFRYQLTCIGSFAQAIIGEEVKDNQFTIKTDKPNVKVSWQVTGIRKDPYANDNRIEVEVDKEPENVGSLLHTPNQTKK